MPTIPNTYTFESTEAEYNLNEIQNLKVLIYELGLAISYLLKNKHGSYEIDTGQTRQRVTRLNLKDLIKERGALIDELESRQGTAGLIRTAVTMHPCF